MTRGVVYDWMYVRVRSAVVKTVMNLQIHTESVCSQSHTSASGRTHPRAPLALRDGNAQPQLDIGVFGRSCAPRRAVNVVLRWTSDGELPREHIIRKWLGSSHRQDTSRDFLMEC